MKKKFVLDFDYLSNQMMLHLRWKQDKHMFGFQFENPPKHSWGKNSSYSFCLNHDLEIFPAENTKNISVLTYKERKV